MAARGWAPDGLADVSVRLPGGCLAITARASRKTAIDAAQIVQLDPVGVARSPWMMPGRGAALHALAYRLLPAAGAVIEALLAGAERLADPQDPCAPRATAPGEEAAAILDGAEALLLSGDAVLVWGVDATAALGRLEALEFARDRALARWHRAS